MTSIRTCALAIAAVFFMGSQASAQLPDRAGPNVNVVNIPLPVTVTNQSIPGTPLQFKLFAGGGGPQTFSVPTGKLLVIEYVSGGCFLAGSTRPDLVILTSLGGTIADHRIEMPSGSIIQQALVRGQLVKIYADGGTNVTLVEPFPSAVLPCSLTFSGLLVTPS